MKRKLDPRKIRHKRLRAKARGTAKRPRLSVFRSNKHLYAQLIDDDKSVVLAGVSDFNFRNKDKKSKKVEIAMEIGRLIAKKAEEKKIKKIVFDRGGYKYHGKVKAIADGAREGGLEF